MYEDQRLQSAISEYERLLASMTDRYGQPVRSEDMIRELRRAHDWTESGARAIVSLANDYGAFMLRNALAVAVAFGIDDGELGF